MSQISRLKEAEIQNGNLINADDISAELDQLVTESNGQDSRLTTLESQDMTLSGVKTFNNGLKADTITEKTAASGVTIDDVRLKGGMVKVAGTPTEDGEIGYADDKLVARIDGQAVELGATPFQSGHLFGLTLSNNTTDAEHDIDIATGKCRDDSDTVNIALASELTKKLDAEWAAGDDAGGFAAGESLPTSGTIHAWAIAKAEGADVDVFFNDHATSGLSPTLPTDYVYKRRIGSFRTDSSANVKAFLQDGDYFYWKIPSVDVDTTQSTTAALYNITVPNAISVVAILSIYIRNNSTTPGVLISDPNTNDFAPGSGTEILAGPINQPLATQAFIRTNTSGQVRGRGSVSGTHLKLCTWGWIDTRGRIA